MERKKRPKGSVWEYCYANKIFGMYGFEIRACGQKLVKFCAHTNTHTHTTAAKLVVRLCMYGRMNGHAYKHAHICIYVGLIKTCTRTHAEMGQT